MVLEPIVQRRGDDARGRMWATSAGDLSQPPRPGDGHARRHARGSWWCRAWRRLPNWPNFQTRLNAMTSGQANYTLAFSHYEAVPPNTQAALVAAHKVQEDE